MRKEENLFLINRVYGNFMQIFPNGATFDEIIHALEIDQLRLKIADLDGINLMGDDVFNDIKNCLPRLLKIIENPRSFIKTSEEKVIIERAKHINKKAISKLSRDSKDWYARTITEVKPKSIVADVNEETIDIYENRLIVALVDKISYHVARNRTYYEFIRNEYIDSKVEQAISFEFSNNQQKSSFFYKLNFGKNNNIGAISEQDIDDRLNEISKVEHKISIIKKSTFYRTLKKKRKVSSPIHLTNILIFEHNYNEAYKLWKILENSVENVTVVFNQEPENNVIAYYKLYVLFNLFVTFEDCGFKNTDRKIVQFTQNQILLGDKNKIEFARNKDNSTIQGMLSVFNEDEFLIEFKQNGMKQSFLIHCDYEDYEHYTPSEVSEILQAKLTELYQNKKKLKDYEKVDSSYLINSFDMNQFKENNQLSRTTIRRLYSIGDSFVGSDIKWNNYVLGSVIMTPIDLQYNLIHLSRIFNFHLLSMASIHSQKLVQCPLCGNRNLKRENETDYKCSYCSHLISITYHDKCDPKRKKPILWIKYSSSDFLKKDVIIQSLNSEIYYKRLRRVEIIMGQFALTSFDVQESNNELKLKSICPHCGEYLGQ